MQTIQQTERPAVGDVIVVGGHFVGNERTMGEILEKKGQFKEAADAYGQAAAQGPRTGELRLRQASALLSRARGPTR